MGEDEAERRAPEPNVPEGGRAREPRAVVPRKPHFPTRQREDDPGYAQHHEGAERVIFQIAIYAQILTATSMVRDWLGVGFWAGLPIH